MGLDLDPAFTTLAARQGVADLETMLSILYSENVAAGHLSLDRFVEVTTANAARIFGLYYPRKGAVAVGSDGDITLRDPGHRRRSTGRGRSRWPGTRSTTAGGCKAGRGSFCGAARSCSLTAR
jgi:dihydroorotase-like cyclic amidohydrolase